MRKRHSPLALAIVSLMIAATSLPSTTYARKSLMEYGDRHANQVHGRHAGHLQPQSPGNGNSSNGPTLSAFSRQGGASPMSLGMGVPMPG